MFIVNFNMKIKRLALHILIHEMLINCIRGIFWTDGL